MRRLALVAAAATAVVLGGAGPAAAMPFLDGEDATALAEVLAEAAKVQGVCYGWSLDLSNAAGTDGVDSGSDRGVGPPPSQISECTKYVELVATVVWTSESSESEDSASFLIRVEGFPSGPTAADVRSTLGINGSDLKNDDGDVVLYRAVAALPRLMADRGLVPSVTIAPAASAPPGTDPTGSRSPDWVRQRQGLLALGGVLIGVAVVMVVIAAYVRRAESRTAAAAAAAAARRGTSGPRRPGGPNPSGSRARHAAGGPQGWSGPVTPPQPPARPAPQPPAPPPAPPPAQPQFPPQPPGPPGPFRARPTDRPDQGAS